MTLGKGFALVLALVGAVALGVWTGPHITHRGATVSDMTGPANVAPDVRVENHSQDVKRASASQRATTKSITTTATTTTPAGTTPRTVPAAAPALHEVLKPLLNKGADMGVASEEFVDAEQFATVAHAARNTDVPFMVLKHRIVDQGKSLEDAIHEFKPGLNAAVEADRARAEAKSDVLALLG